MLVELQTDTIVALRRVSAKMDDDNDRDEMISQKREEQQC